jgi:hypothetical protein
MAAFLAVLLPGAAGAQMISDASRRSMLEAISDVADAPAPDMDKLLAGVGDPFLASAAALPASSASGEAAQVTEGEALLEAAALAMAPTGLLAAGEHSYLSLADGTLREVGVPFSLKLPSGAECRVLILSADDSRFTLRVDGVEKAFLYTEPSGGTPSD